MAKCTMTSADVETEIQRLLQSDEVKLAKKEQRLKNRRKQYMYTLRMLERRGRQLKAEGVTVEDLEAMYSAVDLADREANEELNED